MQRDILQHPDYSRRGTLPSTLSQTLLDSQALADLCLHQEWWEAVAKIISKFPGEYYSLWEQQRSFVVQIWERILYSLLPGSQVESLQSFLLAKYHDLGLNVK